MLNSSTYTAKIFIQCQYYSSAITIIIATQSLYYTENEITAGVTNSHLTEIKYSIAQRSASRRLINVLTRSNNSTRSVCILVKNLSHT